MTRSTPRAARGLVLMVGFLATSVVAGVLGAGLAMPLVGATGSIAQGGVSFFDSLPTALKRDRLAEGLFVHDNALQNQSTGHHRQSSRTWRLEFI